MVMNERSYSLLGIVGPVVSYVSIAISILLSPWFSWQKNALSDLGHATGSSVSPIFNLGLLLGGLLMVIYANSVFSKHSKYTSVCMSLSAFSLQLVATFNETYGYLHYLVSVIFFLSLGLLAIVCTIENKFYFGILPFSIAFISWVAYGRLYNSGIAVPETISSLAIVILIFYSAIRIYLGKDKSNES
jgi:hypothetical membrane protein